jgi:ABC-type multidrug transport system fused ATPase/permease subunit
MPSHSALPWWLSTTACSPPPRSLPASLAFLFLSPCPQRALLAALDLVFLLAALALALRAWHTRRRNDGGGVDHRATEREPLLASAEGSRRGGSVRHGIALAASGTQVAAALVLMVSTLLRLRRGITGPWVAAECALLAAHTVAHLAAAGVVAAERKPGAAALAVHPLHLRLFWLGTAAFAALFSGCAAARYAAREPILPDDSLAFAWLALSLPLLYFSVTGSTGLAVVGASADGGHAAAAEVTYATASWLSLATFGWVSPLIRKGSRERLAAEDIPPVAPADTAEVAYELFTSNWPAPAPGSSMPKHPVLKTMLRSFWPQLLLTAVLGVAHLSVMYIGPSLVDRFVQYIRHGGEFMEGLQLVAILLAGKTAETLASHHYEFQGQKLGMRIHAALLAALYRKSQRLSTGARRAHGAGAIVNYMDVDVEQVSSVMHELHSLWLMPMQIAVALALLYAHLGPAVLTAVAAIVVVTVVVAFANKLNIGYQTKFLGKRDERMKAITDLLNYIRVIKLQAWEEKFGDKIRELREEELGWLAKSMYFMCANTIVLWSGPLAMTVLVFGTCVLTGVELDAGKVFTASAFFHMLDGPMESFPEAISAMTQAAVSLGRLDKFLLEAELDDSAVEHVDDTGICTGEVVVAVHDGVFAWDMRGKKESEEGEDDDSDSNDDGENEDEEEEGEEEDYKDVEVTPVLETVLKEINVEVRKGELVAVVGMVGSGKSSLLSCIMGEMEKVSGTVSA